LRIAGAFRRPVRPLAPIGVAAESANACPEFSPCQLDLLVEIEATVPIEQ
jgi:hypothetical protein